MPYFGIVSVIGIDGLPEQMRRMVQRETRPGVSGQDYWDMGYHGKPFQVTVHSAYSSNALRNLGYQTFVDMIGSAITLTLDNGSVWTNMQVMDDMQKVESFDGAACTNGANFYLAFRVTLEAAA